MNDFFGFGNERLVEIARGMMNILQSKGRHGWVYIPIVARRIGRDPSKKQSSSICVALSDPRYAILKRGYMNELDRHVRRMRKFGLGRPYQ